MNFWTDNGKSGTASLGNGKTITQTCKCGKTTMSMGNVTSMRLTIAPCCGKQD